MKTTNAGDSKALAALIARAAQPSGETGRGPPPVERWHPPFCGDIDMEIRSDGSWWYMGTPIGRPELVKLFSTVLRKDDDGKTYLVTPVEKLGISVIDAPFLAVEMAIDGSGAEQVLTFRTNMGDVVEAGLEHGIRIAVEKGSSGIKPYLLVRGRLEALMTRAVTREFLSLIETVTVDGQEMIIVQSAGCAFAVMDASELQAEMKE